MIRRRIHRTVPHVWSADPSLDQKRLGRLEDPNGIWQTFLKNGDVSVLPLSNGAKPAVFKLTSLTREQLLTLGDLADRETMLRRSDTIVGYGLLEVTNLVDEHDRPLELEFEPWRSGRRVTAKSLEDLYYLDLILELGTRILEISRPDPT